jgi:hypothetical protein
VIFAQYARNQFAAIRFGHQQILLRVMPARGRVGPGVLRRRAGHDGRPEASASLSLI